MPRDFHRPSVALAIASAVIATLLTGGPTPAHADVGVVIGRPTASSRQGSSDLRKENRAVGRSAIRAPSSERERSLTPKDDPRATPPRAVTPSWNSAVQIGPEEKTGFASASGAFSLRALDPRLTWAEINPIIEEAARETGLHPALLRAVIQVGSAFRPYKVSRSGRLGLMQLPRNLAESAGLSNVFDPQENVRVGAHYLKTLVDEFDSVRLALAAYAETPELVRKQPDGARPQEDTRLFVGDVLRAYTNLVIMYREVER